MLHCLTGWSDAEIVSEFGIPIPTPDADGKTPSFSTLVTDWFDQGCPDPPKKGGN